MKDTPAFPTTKPLDSWGDPNQGMTLRDYFAAKAMQGMLPSFANRAVSIEGVADKAYAMADLMLKAREQ